MKRKNDDNIISNKLAKNIDWNDMVSASSIRNYMLDDPLLDWLKYYNISDINSIPVRKNHNTHHNYTNYIMEQGIVFEKYVYEKICEKAAELNLSIIKITDSINSQSIEMFEKTQEHMKKGFDIIYQGVLHDYDNCLYGCPDLLIRSDKFKLLFNHNIESEKYHYVVVDIKHSTIQLNANKEFIKNINSVPAYKGQLNIYNRLLKAVQGYEPPCGYILGKRIMYTKNNITTIHNNIMTNIGVIYFNGIDNNNHIVDKAISWVKRMRTQGNTWKLLPKPSVPELYPNMKNEYDNEYRKLKIELADNIKEITNVWWCGYNKRLIAHSKDIYSWDDTRLTASVMDFNKNNISKTLDHILNINRQNEIKIRLDDIKTKNFWDDNIMEFYIDFETINIDDIEMIFMVGLGWIENDKWCFNSYVCDNSDDICERTIIKNMWDFIFLKLKELNKNDYIFVHWTQAEITFYNKFLNKSLNNDIKYSFKSFDLYKLFLDNNIVVKGALNFSLKTIGNAMYNNNMIKTNWDSNSACSNGLNAMFLAYNEYKKPQKDLKIMEDIKNYNMIDCKIMWEILHYLRNNCS
jgi:hypothetical protein